MSSTAVTLATVASVFHLLAMTFRVEAAAAQAPRQMRFERLSLAQGLSQNTVTCLLQDATGFLWIGTQDGLNRYDGYGIQVYRKEDGDPSSLPHDWILSLALDPSGDLWVGTEGGGLARWRRESDSFDRYLPDPEDPYSISGDRVAVITLDHEGYVWLGTFEAGLDRLDPETGRFDRFRYDPEDPDSLVDDRLRALYHDRSGNLWIGTMGGLDLANPGGGFVHFRHDPNDPTSLSDNRVRAILEDDEGRLWVGTFNGLNRLDSGTGRFVRYFHDPLDDSTLSHDRVRALFSDHAGRFWIGTDGGLDLWQKADAFSRYRHEPANPASLGDGPVLAIFQDSGGLLYVSTAGTGVSKWNPDTWAFSHYRHDGSANAGSNNVFAISEDEHGGVWLGTFGGVERFDRSTGERRAYVHDAADDRSLGDDRVTTLVHDREGALWAGTVEGGLHRFDEEAGTIDRFLHDPQRQDSLSSDAIAAIYEDRSRRLWVGTYGGGLNHYRGNGAFKSFRHAPEDPTSLSNDRVVSLTSDNLDNLWVATDGGGLNYHRHESEFLRFQHDPDDPASLASNELIVIHMDRGGRLWVGTKGAGLDVLRRFSADSKTAIFENYSRIQGLPSNIVWGIESDHEDKIWVSTSEGLACFDPALESFENYSAVNGLQSDDFNMGAHFKSPSGELFFGGVNGFNAFFPERLPVNTHIPPVVLTSFSKLHEPVYYDRPIFDVDEIILGFRDSFFSFEFAALDYTAPGKNLYRYQLENFHEDWFDLGHRRRVDFTNLDPGRYVLRVLGSNNDGIWNPEGLRVELTVLPPWWQTWWARLLGLLAGTSIIVAAYRIRVRAIRVNNEQLRSLVKQRTRELERAQDRLLRQERLAALGEVAGSVAHEIRNPLGAMKNSIFMLKRGVKSEDPQVATDLDLIERQILQANRIISELLDFARQRPAERERFSLVEVSERVISDNPLPDNIDVDLSWSPEPLVVEADIGQIEQILTNLYRNAIEAMPGGGELQVSSRRRGRRGVISFVDAGIGISPDEISKIFEPLYTSKPQGIGLGLALSERYAQLNSGHIECESELGKGAAFRLVLPLVDGDETMMQNV